VIRRDRRTYLPGRALGLAAILLGLAATPAMAATATPSLGVELERDSAAFPTVSRSDERVDYTVRVKNTAPTAAEAGESLACIGTPPDRTWQGEPANLYSFSYQWVRNGVALESAEDLVHGSQSKTYTVQAADEGKALQCLVKGTNQAGSGSFVAASQPATLVSPVPAVEPPMPDSLGARRPQIGGSAKNAGEELTCTAPRDWSLHAIADTKAGSTTLTDAFTAEGFGTFGAGSTAVSNVGAIRGAYHVGQTISAAGMVPPGTTIVAVSGAITEDVDSHGALTLSAPATGSGGKSIFAGAQPLAVGETIAATSAAGKNLLPPGTTIESVSGQTVTVSQPATETASAAVVLAPSLGSWSFRWLRDGEPAPGPVGTPTPVSSRYTLTAEDVEAEGSGGAAPAVFQCEAIATNAVGDATLVESDPVATQAPAEEFEAEGQPGFKPFLSEERAKMPVVEQAEKTTGGTVTAELELPGGLETSAFRVVDPYNNNNPPSGWTCQTTPAFGAQPARALCTRADPLAPQGSYPGIKVIAKLGADAPDTAVASATAYGGGAPSAASATDEFTFAPALPFGLSSFESRVLDPEGNDYTQAGGHPFSAAGAFVANRKRQLTPGQSEGKDEAEYTPIENVKQVITDLPPGFVGNQTAVPQLCPTLKDVEEKTCPPGSRVGGVEVALSGISFAEPESIYAIKPEFGTPAQFAFEAGGGLYTFSARLRPQDGYAVSLELAPALINELLKAKATFCDYGVNTRGETTGVTGCKEAGEAGANPKPLLTTPTRCGAPAPAFEVHLDSWEHPGAFGPEGSPDYGDPNWKLSEATTPETTGCAGVDFEPAIGLGPSSHQADSPTGLDINLSMPTNGLEGKDAAGEPDPEALAQSNLRGAKITFPVGMAVNPSAAQGLGACSAAQIKLDTDKPIECPGSAKIGTVEIETPVLKEALQGDVYIAKQGDVEGSLLGIYLVFESPKDGILIKLPGKITPDPVTGQLVATVDESPQQPFSAVRMHFPGGPQATLLTPPKCGSYQITSELTPWDGAAPVTETSSFAVNQGPNGGPCPGGGLDPKFSAGATNPLAGQTSPFVVHLSREDGSQRFSALNLTMPPGVGAYLRGVPYCPDSTLASISSEPGTGEGQIDSPSCPAASQVGTVTAGAGAGPSPFYTDKGRAYLAGPYKGAPLSIAVVTPAVAGPLDLGSVVIRNALYVNPETAQVTVKSDPIPTILHGLPLDVRDIRIAIDKPNFTLNPTHCEPLSIGAAVTGEQGATADLSNRFQVGGCESLPYKPGLTARLSGPTKRGKFPALKATLTAKAGEANTSFLSVTLPHSEFLEQGHFGTICTRMQFAASQCPPASVYGQVKVQTPLLSYPLEGPVYLRSSNHNLPDLVLVLKGPPSQPIEVTLDGRIDSKDSSIRTTFEAVPDAPFTEATLTMPGGKRGLLVNSTNVCASVNRATVRMTGQNGKASDFRPALISSKCPKGEHKRHKRHHHRATR
jgi:hypothetical protein